MKRYNIGSIYICILSKGFICLNNARIIYHNCILILFFNCGSDKKMQSVCVWKLGLADWHSTKS